MIHTLTITEDMKGLRLDEALARLAVISKGEARRIIDRGGCALNDSMVRVASRAVKTGDRMIVGMMQPGEFRELVLPPETIVYQDSDLLALNKPSGVASQRTPYQLKGTLEYWVAEEFVRQGINEPVRVVHRLDRGTSGLMLFPKNRQCAAWLSDLFSKGAIAKCYLALVSGTSAVSCWSSEGPIGKLGTSRWGIMPGGRAAHTDFRLLSVGDGISLVEARPRTGRTHQIRVHLADAGFPIVGDATYGGKQAHRLMLHCVELSFNSRQGSPLHLRAEPCPDFIEQCGSCWLSDNNVTKSTLQ